MYQAKGDRTVHSTKRFATRNEDFAEENKRQMPVLSEETATQAVAILVSDLHFSHKPPIARSCEPNWYAVQKRYCKQLRRLQTEHAKFPTDPLPIICAGDYFDKWNAPAELVNFLLENLPHTYGIPGQHDLPHHSYEDMHKSAFWTLVKSGKITLLEPGKPQEISRVVPLRLHGFPWRSPLKSCADPQDLAIEIAVVHSYIWTRRTGYQGAPEEKRLERYKKKLQGYNVALFGDNHTPFHCELGSCSVWNSGGFQRRRSDEVNHKPSVGLLRANDTIERLHLDVSKDQFLKAEEMDQLSKNPSLETFLEELSSLNDSNISFSDAVHRFLDNQQVPDEVRNVVLQAMEDKK